MNRKLDNDQPETFDDLTTEEVESSEALTTALVRPPLLYLPHANFRYTLDTDPSNVQIGCKLIQDEPDDAPIRPIGDWSPHPQQIGT